MNRIQPASSGMPGISCSWRVTGATAPGVSHLKQGLPCQDALGYELLDIDGQNVLLVALADGAGSAEHSERGAQLAVQVALDTMACALEDEGLPDVFEDMLRLAFEQALHALQGMASLEELPLRTLATTLTCVIALPGRLSVGQLGDGVVVAQLETGELTAIIYPQRGEYANETYFLVQEDALTYVQIKTFEAPVQALAVMSDGLVRLALKLPEHEPHLPFFKPLFAFATAMEDPQDAIRQLAAFLESERVCDRTDDDKALVLAICPAIASPPQETHL